MRRAFLATAGVIAAVSLHAPARASSHKEAPAIAAEPRLDGTDFYFFRSYEKGRQNYVTFIADYIPLQDPYGGPNFTNLDPDAYYDINLDTTGSARADMRFRFKFTTTTRNLTLNVGGKAVKVPLVNTGPISAGSLSNQNVYETYTLSVIRGDGASAVESPITSSSGSATFGKPIDDIGKKSIADYDEYAHSFVYSINIPGCGAGRVFAGQRKDPFVVNLGQTFDLINYKNPVGEQYANSVPDSLVDKNVTSLVLEVPISCITKGGDPVVGGWTTSSKFFKQGDGSVKVFQHSRLANPLVNEVVIGLNDKDRFNLSAPLGDPQFITYVTNPTLPAIIETFTGAKAPTAFPRNDLVAVFLTGISGLNQPKALSHPGEEMRLNTSIAPVARGSQNRLGVIAGDNAGFPNGRRPGDDVVDIELRVVMGRLFTLGLFGKPSDAPTGNLDFTDGAYTDSTHYDATFPYVRDPIPGSP